MNVKLDGPFRPWNAWSCIFVDLLKTLDFTTLISDNEIKINRYLKPAFCSHLRFLKLNAPYVSLLKMKSNYREREIHLAKKILLDKNTMCSRVTFLPKYILREESVQTIPGKSHNTVPNWLTSVGERIIIQTELVCNYMAFYYAMKEESLVQFHLTRQGPNCNWKETHTGDNLSNPACEAVPPFFCSFIKHVFIILLIWQKSQTRLTK